MSETQIVRITREDIDALNEASHLFDRPAQFEWSKKFLETPTHHLLIAYEGSQKSVGFVTGIEMTHPDKGTEMFLYELGVDSKFRGKGIGAELVLALEKIAKQRGCYGMWVLTDRDNDAALVTYRKAGAIKSEEQVTLSWEF